MKQLVCEKCGNPNLIRQGDIFVCEYCGSRYYDDSKDLPKYIAPDLPVGYEHMLERGKTFLKLKDYDNAYKAFKVFADIYPYRYIGYKYMIIALSHNFNNTDPPEYVIKDAMEKMKKVLEDGEKEDARIFAEKTAKYLEWTEVCERYNRAEADIKATRQKYSVAIEKKETDIRNGKYMLLSVIMFVILAVVMPYIWGFFAALSAFELIVGIITLWNAGNNIPYIQNELNEQTKKLQAIEHELETFDFKKRK